MTDHTEKSLCGIENCRSNGGTENCIGDGCQWKGTEQRPLTLEEAKNATAKGNWQKFYEKAERLGATLSIEDAMENAAELYLKSHLTAKDKEIERLKRTRDEMFSLWEPVDEYVRNLPTTRLGESVSSKALEMLKENARLKKEIELSNLILATSTECWKSDNALLKERIEAAEMALITRDGNLTSKIINGQLHSLRKLMKWHKADEEPMPEDGFYLVRCPNINECGYAIAEWDNNLFSWFIDGDDQIDNFVTHWAELIEPEK